MVDLLCMGEPMLEFNQLPPKPDGSRHYLEGHGGDTSNAAIAAARQGASVGYITALGLDMPGDSFMALWAREGVDAATVARTDRWQTGVYFVTHDAQGHHFLHYRANSAAAMYTPAELPEAGDCRSAHVLCLRHQPRDFRFGVRCGVRRDRYRATERREGCVRYQLPAAPVAAGARCRGDACRDGTDRLRAARDRGCADPDRADRS